MTYSQILMHIVSLSLSFLNENVIISYTVACSTVTVTKCLAALKTLQAFPFFRPTCLCKEPGLDPECNNFLDFLFDHPCGLVRKKGMCLLYCALLSCLFNLCHPSIHPFIHLFTQQWSGNIKMSFANYIIHMSYK